MTDEREIFVPGNSTYWFGIPGYCAHCGFGDAKPPIVHLGESDAEIRCPLCPNCGKPTMGKIDLD